MRRLLKLELRRAFCSRTMGAAVILGLAVVAAHLLQYVIPLYNSACMMEEMIAEKGMAYTPRDVYGVWLGGGTFSMESFLYYLLLPILAVLPFGASYFEDQKGGVIKNICIRAERKSYLRAKFAAAFLSGGTAFVVPLLVSLGVCAVLFPSLQPWPSTTYSTVSAFSAFYEVFYTHPYLYILIYLILDFIYAGIMAVTALAASSFTDYKFMVLITPFIIYIFIFSMCNLFEHLECSPVYMLNGGYNQGNLLSYCIQIVILGGAACVIYFLGNRKADVY